MIIILLWHSIYINVQKAPSPEIFVNTNDRQADLNETWFVKPLSIHSLRGEWLILTLPLLAFQFVVGKTEMAESRPNK